jgi:ATP-dependent Clp protease adapter protein ClpS
MSHMPKVNALTKYEVILNDDINCPYSEITKSLKLIFNYSETEAGLLAIRAHDGGSVLLETIHGEKKSLREEQLKRWSQSLGNHSLPITFKLFQGK